MSLDNFTELAYKQLACRNVNSGFPEADSGLTEVVAPSDGSGFLKGSARLLSPASICRLAGQ